MNKAVVIPTGGEIREGILLDTDSPEVIRQLLERFPCCQVTRAAPLLDEENAIAAEISLWAKQNVDLIVLIGGSGGGRRFCESLSKDATHVALEAVLARKASKEIYGKNGHLWCKLLCGKIGETVAVNLPGPFKEAKAAFSAFLNSGAGADCEKTASAMAQAVLEQYGNEC